MWKRIASKAFTAHLWNKYTAALELQSGSVLHRLLFLANETEAKTEASLRSQIVGD